MINEKPLIELFYFTGNTCNVCHVLKPKIFNLQQNEFPEFGIRFINIEEEPEVAAQFMVFSLPVLLIMVDQKESNRFKGSFSVQEVRERLERIKQLLT